MRNATKAWVLALCVGAADCTEWVPASVNDARGQEYVRVYSPAAKRPMILELPSRRELRALERENARFEVRRVSSERIAVATLAIVMGVVVMAVGIVAMSASDPFLAWSGLR